MKTANKWIAVALVLAGVVLLTLLGNRLPGQLDLTGSRLFTLSDASRNLLAGLPEPVTLEFYFSRSLEGLPIQFKNVGTQVEDLLRQYQRAARGNLRLRVIDPRPDTDEEQAAIRAGLRSQPLPTGENLFFGLVAHYAEASAAIPFFNLNRQSFLEYDISQLIFQVQQPRRPVIGILSSLELEPPVNPMQPAAARDQPGAAFLQELRRAAEVRVLEGPAIPAEIELLLVIHPQNLGAATLYSIDQYALSGRPLLVALDPASYVQRARQDPQMMMMGGMPETSSQLGPLLAAWGIEFDPFRVVGDPALAATVTTQAGGPPIRFPVWLNYNRVESDSPLLANLSDLLFVEAGFFEWNGEGRAGVEWTPLLQTTAGSGAISAQMLRFSAPDQIARSLTADGRKRTLAGILRGTLESAYPDGPPAAEGEGEQAAAPAAGEHLARSSRPSTVVLIGDTDFLANDFAVRFINLFGMRAMNPINDNLAFLLNLVDSLSGNPELITLRGKGTTVRPFTVVQELERKAQAAYQEQLQALETRLQEVRARLSELQQQAQRGNQLVAGAEVQEAIARFRLEEAQVRAEQRQIRKRLREDIEALNLRLALVNLLTAPVVIAACGIGYFTRRNRKSA